MIEPIVFSILIVALFVMTCWPLVHWLSHKTLFSFLEQILFTFAAGYYLIYIGVALIGSYKLDEASMGLLAIVIFILATFGALRFPWRKFCVEARKVRREITENKWTISLSTIFVFVAITSLLQGLSPPNDYDSFLYHLSIPKLDVERGFVEPPWDRGLSHAFFPALLGNFTRFALVMSEAGAAQIGHGLLSIAAALACVAIVRRLGFQISTAVLAAIMFLALRVVVWQMGTVQVDAPLAAYAALSILAYLEWRRSQTLGAITLFGIMIGLGCLVKYHGFIIAASFIPIIVYDCIRKPGSISKMFFGPVTALVLMAPHLIHNFIVVGDPVFPILTALLNSDYPNMVAEHLENYGAGRDLLSFILGPWNLSVFPLVHFDGMVLGAPYLFVFAPFIFAQRSKNSDFWVLLSVVLAYYPFWFWAMSQQARFLLPVLPVACCFAAGGAALVWKYSARTYWLRLCYVGICLIYTTNQLMFVGIYSAIRLPVSLGLISEEQFLTKTPTMSGAEYPACTYIKNNLLPENRYYSQLSPHSYYCPQFAADFTFLSGHEKTWMSKSASTSLSPQKFLEKLDKAQYQFYLFRTADDHRRNGIARPERVYVDPSTLNYGNYFGPILERTTPIFSGRYSNVYDGRDILLVAQKLFGSSQK